VLLYFIHFFYFRSLRLNNSTRSIFLNLFNLVFFLLDQFIFGDQSDPNGNQRWKQSTGRQVVSISGEIGIKRESTMVNVPSFSKDAPLRPYTEKIRSFTSVNAPYAVSVFLRIQSRRYTTIILDHVIRRNTVVYGVVNGRERPYTESVTIDLVLNQNNTSKSSGF
jgi:hypothetical protein